MFTSQSFRLWDMLGCTGRTILSANVSTSSVQPRKQTTSNVRHSDDLVVGEFDSVPDESKNSTQMLFLFFITALFLDQLLVLSTIGTCVATKWPSRGPGVGGGGQFWKVWEYVEILQVQIITDDLTHLHIPQTLQRELTDTFGCLVVLVVEGSCGGGQLECVSAGTKTAGRRPTCPLFGFGIWLCQRWLRNPIGTLLGTLHLQCRPEPSTGEDIEGTVQRSMQLFLKLMFLPVASILVTISGHFCNLRGWGGRGRGRWQSTPL